MERPSNRFPDLSPREKQVFDLVVLGKRNKAIAEALGLSVRTVELHRIKLIKKLGVDNMAALMWLALTGEKPPADFEHTPASQAVSR